MGSDEKDMARLWCDFQSLTHENRESAMAKAGTVAGEMEERKLRAAANRLREGVGETAACLLPGFPRTIGSNSQSAQRSGHYHLTNVKYK